MVVVGEAVVAVALSGAVVGWGVGVVAAVVRPGAVVFAWLLCG